MAALLDPGDEVCKGIQKSLNPASHTVHQCNVLSTARARQNYAPLIQIMYFPHDGCIDQVDAA
jgi:hypothetical protein